MGTVYTRVFRNEHNWKIKTMRKRTNYGKYSFINKTIKSWNQLPAGLLASFPSKQISLKKRDKNAVKTKYF
jgi:hypothetical protein